MSAFWSSTCLGLDLGYKKIDIDTANSSTILASRSSGCRSAHAAPPGADTEIQSQHSGALSFTSICVGPSPVLGVHPPARVSQAQQHRMVRGIFLSSPISMGPSAPSESHTEDTGHGKHPASCCLKEPLELGSLT